MLCKEAGIQLTGSNKRHSLCVFYSQNLTICLSLLLQTFEIFINFYCLPQTPVIQDSVHDH